MLQASNSYKVPICFTINVAARTSKKLEYVLKSFPPPAIFKRFVLFCVREHSACLLICTLCICLVPAEFREGYQAPQYLSHKWLSVGAGIQTQVICKSNQSSPVPETYLICNVTRGLCRQCSQLPEGMMLTLFCREKTEVNKNFHLIFSSLR